MADEKQILDLLLANAPARLLTARKTVTINAPTIKLFLDFCINLSYYRTNENFCQKC